MERICQGVPPSFGWKGSRDKPNKDGKLVSVEWERELPAAEGAAPPPEEVPLGWFRSSSSESSMPNRLCRNWWSSRTSRAARAWSRSTPTGPILAILS